MKKINRFFSVLIACCMLFSLLGVPVSADDVIASDEIETSSVYSEGRNEYIKSVLPDYLSAEGIQYTNVKISDPIQVKNNNDDESRLYLITSCDQYIARLNVSVNQKNGYFISGFLFDENDQMNQIIKRNIPFAIVHLDAIHTVLQTEDGNFPFSSFDDSSVLNENNIPSYDLTTINFYDIDISENLDWSVNQAEPFSLSGTDYTVFLPVSFVKNGSTILGDGLCWAACVAAVSNYTNGTSYTAIQIYNALDYLYSGVPIGTNEWITKAYDYCGMGCFCRGTLTFFDLYEILHDQGSPAILGFYSSNGEDAHSLGPDGYKYSDYRYTRYENQNA